MKSVSMQGDQDSWFKNNMRLKLIALTVWLVIPYVIAVVRVPLIEWIQDRNVSFAYLLQWNFHFDVLVWCVLPAALGVGILWLLPIRRFWLGTIVGTLAAIGGISLTAWLKISLYGGFEENVDVMVGAFDLLLPSCLAGAFAGFLRFKDQQAKGSADVQKAMRSKKLLGFSTRGYLARGLIIFVVITAVWVICMGRLRRWW